MVPKGTQTGRTFRLRGRGVPHVRAAAAATCWCAVVVDTPTALGEEEDQLMRRLAELRGEEVGTGRQRVPLPHPVRLP